MTYTIERLSKPEDFTEDIIKFLKEEAPKLSALFNDVFNCESFRLYMFAQRGAFLICRRDGEIRGTIIAALQETLLDPKVKMLKQILFYVKPKSGRTAYYLFKKFIASNTPPLSNEAFVK